MSPSNTDACLVNAAHFLYSVTPEPVLHCMKKDITETNQTQSSQHYTSNIKCISLTVLFPFPFKCKPLSKSGEDTRLWSEDGPGEPVEGRTINGVLYINGFWRVAVKHLIRLHVTSSISSSLTATPKFIVIHLKGHYCVCSAALPVSRAELTPVLGWPASKRDKCCSLIWYQLGIRGLASSCGHTQ